MPGVSLRTIAVLLSVAYAIVMASITLGVTVTVTTDSLRRFGKNYAGALADVTLMRLQAFFELPSQQIDVLKNATRLDNVSPSVGLSALKQQLWIDRCTFDLFSVPSSRASNVLFTDGTRPFATVLQAPTDVNEDRFAVGLQTQIESFAMPGNFSSTWGFRHWYYDDHMQLMPNTSWWWSSAQYKIDTTAVLSTLQSGTFGGRITLWYSQPLLIVFGLGTTPTLHTVLVAPLRDSRGVVVGYTGPAITLTLINSFLQAIQETPHSYGFIVDGLGQILATSCPIPFNNLTVAAAGVTPPLGCESTGASFLSDANAQSDTQYVNCRTTASQYPYAPLRAAMQNSDLASATTQTAIYMVVEGDGYFVVSSPVAMRYPNLVLQLIITMPELELVGDLATPRNIAIGVSVAIVLALSGAIAALVSFLFAPIANTATRLHDDEPLASDDGPPAPTTTTLSTLVEVRDVQVAHRAMRGELRRIRAFVPERALSSSDDSPSSVTLVLPASPNGSASPDVATNPLLVSIGASADDADGDMPAATTSVEPSTAPALPAFQRVRRRVRFVDEDGTSLVRYNVVEVPLMSVRQVAVLSANVNGFRRWCVKVSSWPVQDTVTGLMRGVCAVVRDARDAILRHGGIVERFCGDEVEASFISQGKQPPQVRAVLAGLELLEHAGGTDGASSPSDPSPLRWRVGVAYGSAVVGEAGSDTAQSSHIIGAAWTHAVALQQLSKVYRAKGVVLSDRLFALLRGDSAFEWRALGAEQLPGQTRKSVVLAARRRRTAVIVDEPHRHAVALRNARVALQSEDDPSKTAAVEAALRAHMNEQGVDVNVWEMCEYVQWSDIPALTRLRDIPSEQWQGVVPRAFATFLK